MTTFFQPGGPQVGGPYDGNAAEPQQYYPAAGYPPAPVPQVDHHHPYPAYRPEQAAWSQPMPQPMSQRMSQPMSQPMLAQPISPSMVQQYQPPTWTTPPATGGNRNKLVAALIAV